MRGSCPSARPETSREVRQRELSLVDELPNALAEQVARIVELPDDARLVVTRPISHQLDSLGK